MFRNSVSADSMDTSIKDPDLYIANPAKAKAAMQAMMDDFREMGPLLDKDQKIEILRFCRISIAETYVDIGKIQSQFALVEHIKDSILIDDNIREETTVRDLTAFTNAVGNLTGLFLRNQEKFDHMREMQNMRDAVIAAIEDQPPEVQAKFFTKLDELNIASY